MRDLDALSSWHADWSGLRVAVLGLGVTGFAAADTLAELGARVLVVAGAADDDRAAILEVIGVGLALQDAPEQIPDALDQLDPELIIVSPGFAPSHPLLRWAQQRGTPIWGDIELAWRVRDKVAATEWITVTGTNGKTTTTQLTEHMLLTAGVRGMAVGNIGVPVLDAVRLPEGLDVLVVELSSFQLHWLPETGPGALRPLASVCLNIADDHLDWHGSREAYLAAKGRVYANTRIACVYNLHDEATRTLVEEADVQEGCRAIGFGLGAPGPSDFGIVDGLLIDRAFLEERADSALEVADLEDLAVAGLHGPHLAADVLAAAALARAAGVEPRSIRDAVRSFRLDAHRTQRIAVSAGITWVDDSKATNPHAAAASLVAFRSVVWIAGGLLKGVDVSALVAESAQRLRAVVLIGTDRAELVAAFARHAPGVPLFEVIAADTEQVMPEAVRLAATVAREGDTVLLAPAGASFDQFTGYDDRGRRFAAAVHELVGGAADAEPENPGDPAPPAG